MQLAGQALGQLLAQLLGLRGRRYWQARGMVEGCARKRSVSGAAFRGLGKTEGAGPMQHSHTADAPLLLLAVGGARDAEPPAAPQVSTPATHFTQGSNPDTHAS